MTQYYMYVSFVGTKSAESFSVNPIEVHERELNNCQFLQPPPNNGYGRTPFSAQDPPNNGYRRMPFSAQDPPNNGYGRMPGKMPYSYQGSYGKVYPGRCPLFVQVCPGSSSDYYGMLALYFLCFTG